MLWWIDSCACLTVRILGALVCALPVNWALWLGRRVGDLMYAIKPSRVELAARNLHWAFGARYTPRERLRLMRESFQTLGQTGVELLRLPRIDAAYVERYIAVHGIEYLEATRAQGRGITPPPADGRLAGDHAAPQRQPSAGSAGGGVIFLTGHFGNWELSSIVGALKGYPMVALAREQKLPRLYRLLNSYREAKGCRVIGKGMALRAMVRELKANRIVGIVGDQGAKTQGVRVMLFGRDALTPPGPVELAVRTGAIVLPTFIHRTRGPHHVIDIEPPLDLAPREGETTEAIVQRGLQIFMERLEAHIRQTPGQWLWMHRRWKSTRHRHALILSDGKAGHVKQSLAVVEALSAVRPQPVTHNVLDVAYRSAAHRFIVTLATWLPWISARGVLRWALTTREALLETPCNYVISCGAATAPVNLLLGRMHDAKTVVIMRPSLVPLRQFDLAFLPMHDRPARAPNIVRTLGALTSITPQRLQATSHRLAERFDVQSARRIGVLLGGDTDDTQLTPQMVTQFLDQLESLCQQWPAQLLVTTSRRTSATIEQLCADRLHQREHCPLLVLANRANAAGVVEDILGAAEIIVVSGESSSMVSEAVASGRPVVVIAPEPKPAQQVHRKRRLFLETLSSLGRVIVVPPERLSDAVTTIATRQPQHNASDWDTVCAAVRGL